MTVCIILSLNLDLQLKVKVKVKQQLNVKFKYINFVFHYPAQIAAKVLNMDVATEPHVGALEREPMVGFVESLHHAVIGSAVI